MVGTFCAICIVTDYPCLQMLLTYKIDELIRICVLSCDFFSIFVVGGRESRFSQPTVGASGSFQQLSQISAAHNTPPRILAAKHGVQGQTALHQNEAVHG